MATTVKIKIRKIRSKDVSAIAAIDASHSGILKLEWWQDVAARHTRRTGPKGRVGLVAVDPTRADRLLGFLFGQVRAFEFGSEPCGWIYSVGVHPGERGHGIASQLFRESKSRFAALGVRLVRTMVKRDDVSVLRFFRSQGFAAGPYVEMELPITEQET